MRRRSVDTLGQPDGENLAAERCAGKSARPTAEKREAGGKDGVAAAWFIEKRPIEKTDRTGAVGRSNLPDRNVQRALPIRRMSGG